MRVDGAMPGERYGLPRRRFAQAVLGLGEPFEPDEKAEVALRIEPGEEIRSSLLALRA